MELTLKTLDFTVKQVGSPNERTLEFIGSTAHVDRYGDIIEVDGWDYGNYMAKGHGPFLWAHNYNAPPVGKTIKVSKEKRGLVFRVYFPTPEEYGEGFPNTIPSPDTVYRLYLGGYLKATSVGFRDLEREPITNKEGKQTGWRYLKQELYELSAVPVPANPNALMMAVQKGIITPQEVEEIMDVPFEKDLIDEAGVKGVIPFKEYPTDPIDAPWDGPAEIKQAEVDDLKVICTWYDSENPDIKGSYKLPHHRAKGYKVVWQGVSAAMAALLGARGGVNVSEADRQGIYNHLARHYAQFEKEPPEFKEFSEVNLRRIETGLDPVSDEAEKSIDSFYQGISHYFRQAVEEALADFFKVGEASDVKAGAVLNAKNKGLLRQAQTFIQQVLDSAEDASPEDDNQEQSATSWTAAKDIYSLALNPGYEPEGERPAGELDFSQLLSSTQNLHRKVKGGNQHVR